MPMDALQYEKRGYLLEPYRLFHLDTALTEDTAFHFHEFHKIVFFLAGRGNYTVEGRNYELKPNDIILVRQGAIHKASIDPTARYERIILYIDPEFLRKNSTATTSLEKCFDETARQKSYVLRPNPVQLETLLKTLSTLEQTLGGTEYGQDLSADISLMQILIDLGRGRSGAKYRYTTAQNKDDKTVRLIEYINDHLTEQISIDLLADRFYLSKYYMMRMFHSGTGYTIHSYLTEKRLHLAREMIRGGANASEACYGCGYQDYSAFARAYKKRFGVSPSRKPEAEA